MKDVLKNLPPLVDTVTVKVANVTKYDSITDRNSRG